jgi:hypothetical protein
MALSGNISSIINLGERAFPHLYDVDLLFTDNSQLQERITGIPSISNQKISPFITTASAESVTYEGGYSIESFYSDILFQSFPNKANKVKGMTIDFRETANFTYIKLFEAWMGTIYSKSENCFLSGDPRAVIIVTVQNPIGGGDTKFTHSGVIPKSINYPKFSYSSTEPIVTSVTFSIEGLDIK